MRPSLPNLMLPSLILFFLPALALGQVPADDWPAYQHDVHHTGRSDAHFDPNDLVFSGARLQANLKIHGIAGQPAGRLLHL